MWALEDFVPEKSCLLTNSVKQKQVRFLMPSILFDLITYLLGGNRFLLLWGSQGSGQLQNVQGNGRSHQHQTQIRPIWHHHLHSSTGGGVQKGSCNMHIMLCSWPQACSSSASASWCWACRHGRSHLLWASRINHHGSLCFSPCRWLFP